MRSVQIDSPAIGRRHGLLGEIQAHARPVALRLAGGMIVDLEDDVRARAGRDVRSLRARTGASCRASSLPGPGYGQLDDRAAHPAGESGRRVGLLATAGVAGLVQVDPAVMHDPAVARLELDARDGHVAICRHRHGERAIGVPLAADPPSRPRASSGPGRASPGPSRRGTSATAAGPRAFPPHSRSRPIGRGPPSPGPRAGAHRGRRRHPDGPSTAASRRRPVTSRMKSARLAASR